jgi:hypothetical protein
MNYLKEKDMFCLIKRLAPLTLAFMALALFALSGCSDSDSGGSAGSYSIYFYDGDLELKEILPVGGGEVIDLDAKTFEFGIDTYGWYEAGSDKAFMGNYAAAGNITLYAAPSIVEINTEEELINIKDDLAGRYVLKSDIALTDEWTPIGDDSSRFSGRLDGRGHKITGLWIDALNDGEYIGLFGYIDEGVVRNLRVETTAKGIEGKSNVGIITGYLLGGKIESVHTSGNINITLAGKNVGGIVGYISSEAAIKDAHSTANIHSANATNIGGIVGDINGSVTIEECSSTGDLWGASYIGGIAGNTAGTITIIKSYYTGNILGTETLGGITGNATGAVIKNSYSNGSVVGSGANIGGIAGSGSSFEITDSYSTAYLASSTNNSNAGGIVGKVSSAAVILNSYFAGMIRAVGSSGGIVGSASGSGAGLEIKNCFFSGTLFSSSGSLIGGIAGQISGIVSITKNYSSGTVVTSGTSSGTTIGGIVGSLSGSNTDIALTDNVLASQGLYLYSAYGGNVKNRLVGSITASSRIVIGNLAYKDIDTNDDRPFSNTASEEYHGTDATKEELTAKSTYADIQQWAFGDDSDHPWKWNAFPDYPYPTLYWQTEQP